MPSHILFVKQTLLRPLRQTSVLPVPAVHDSLPLSRSTRPQGALVILPASFEGAA